MNREMDYDDPTVQDEQPSRDRTAERQDAIATNATPSCLPELPVAVEGSPQSEGNASHRGEHTVQTPWGYFPASHRSVGRANVTPGIARQIPHHTPTHTQQHTQPKGSGRVNDGASSLAMATTHRSANPEGFMTAEQEVRRKQLDLDLLKVELQKKEIELRERELEFLQRRITPAREPRTDATNARAWLPRAENGVSAAAERCNKNYDGEQYRRNAAYPTAAAENSASYGPEPAEFREWRRAFEERLSRVPRNNNGHSTSAPPPPLPPPPFGHSTLAPPSFQHRTWAPPQFGHSTSARPHASHNGFTGQYAGTFGYGSAFLSQSQIAARHASSRELPTFSGFPDEWPLFIASYEHSTTICGYSDDENLLRLQKALKGAALEAVGPLLFLPSGLREAISTLRLRFGRPEVIVEGLIDKVKRMPVPRSDRLDTLVDFGFAVRNMCATIRAAGLPEYTCNVVLLKELVAKLPSGTCVEWARHRRQLPSVTLTEFGAWIGNLAESLSVGED
uniref:Uncharacterized protein n=1 Tax=Anopheles dirus TaxID=7168 RepID=A0A182NXA4_9DIPT